MPEPKDDKDELAQWYEQLEAADSSQETGEDDSAERDIDGLEDDEVADYIGEEDQPEPEDAETEDDEDDEQGEDPAEEEGSEEAEEADGEDAGEDDSQDEQPEIPRVPIIEVSKARRETRQTKRELREAQDQIKALQGDIARMSRQATAAGVEFTDERIEFNDDTYLSLVDKFDEETANLFMQQHNQIQALTDQVSGNAKPAYSGQEVTEAIQANDTLAQWIALAKNGKPEAWDMAREIDNELDDSEFEDLDERFEEVVRLAKAKIATVAASKAEAGKVEKPRRAKRSLNDQPGQSQQTVDLNYIKSLPIGDQWDAFSKLSRSRREQIEAQLFS